MTKQELEQVMEASYQIARCGVSYNVATIGLNEKQLVLLKWSLI